MSTPCQSARRGIAPPIYAARASRGAPPIRWAVAERSRRVTQNLGREAHARKKRGHERRIADRASTRPPTSCACQKRSLHADDGLASKDHTALRSGVDIAYELRLSQACACRPVDRANRLEPVELFRAHTKPLEGTQKWFDACQNQEPQSVRWGGRQLEGGSRIGNFCRNGGAQRRRTRRARARARLSRAEEGGSRSERPRHSEGIIPSSSHPQERCDHARRAAS